MHKKGVGYCGPGYVDLACINEVEHAQAGDLFFFGHSSNVILDAGHRVAAISAEDLTDCSALTVDVEVHSC